MGQFKKQHWEEQSAFDKYVCSNHFTDDAIIDFIEEESIDGICGYCKLRYQHGKVILLEDLVDFLMAGIGHFYGDPNDEGVGWDSSEGGWQGTCVYDTYELLQDEIALEVDEDLLFSDITDLIPNYEWCQRDPYALPEHQELSYDWRRFCDIVKHKMRYSFFKSKEYDSPEKEFSDILRQIAVGVDSLSLIKDVKKDSIVYRCRQHELTEVVSSIEKLTSPPDKLANFPNRMSPAGISMFYGASDKDTAMKEVLDEKWKDSQITMGTFALKQDLQIIDLTHLPEIPSIFDKINRKHYYKILFFRSFVDDLSKDIKHDKKNHIEYVPTQIMTEYFRYVFPEISDIKIDGILYPSSKNGGNCYVLFFDNKASLEFLDLKSIEVMGV